jgi:predicted nucleic acid-binding protein
MKIFIDTNILLDFITERPGVEDASMILQLGEDSVAELATSVLSMANVAYVAKRGRTNAELYALLGGLSDLVEILQMDSKQFSLALKKEVSDFEDMLQYQCAVAAGCDVIVTRNKKDFKFASLPVVSPRELLSAIKQ